MNILPIQVVDGGVLIPLEYLQNAREFEVEMQDEYVIVRPKTNGSNGHPHAAPLEKIDPPIPSQKPNWLQEISGIFETADPTASSRVKEILMDEIDSRSGWTTKPPLETE